MTWGETLKRAADYLAAKGVDDAAVAVEFLLARLLACGRGELVGELAAEADERRLAAMRRGVVRLAQGEPVQYVIGEWDFRSLKLKCDRRALIPRPETEELVTRVLTHLRARPAGSPPPFVVDVGTGTGAIILALAREFTGAAVLLGTDVSPAAIELARENAALTGLEGRVRFAVADGLDDFDEPESVDVIVSNPPYVERAVCDRLDRRVRDFEPRLALDGGESGLDFYDRYLADALNLLKPGGAVFFEIGENQGAAVAQLMADYGFSAVRVEKDFAGHDRYAMATVA